MCSISSYLHTVERYLWQKANTYHLDLFVCIGINGLCPCTNYGAAVGCTAIGDMADPNISTALAFEPYKVSVALGYMLWLTPQSWRWCRLD
jgi:hypothetical protein